VTLSTLRILNAEQQVIQQGSKFRFCLLTLYSPLQCLIACLNKLCIHLLICLRVVQNNHFFLGTHIPYDEAGETGVICNKDLPGLICYASNQTDGSCLDYEIRVFCDECSSTTAPTTKAPNLCKPRWLDWVNTMTPNGDMNYVEHEFMTLAKQQELCFDGKINRIECETTNGISHFSSGEKLTCDILSGLTCRNSDNYPVPCNDYKVRYFCDCEGKTFMCS